MADPVSLVKEAEKLKKPQLGFLLFFTGSSSYRLEEASDLYVQAANLYRLRKEFELSGEQFIRAAELQKELQNYNDVANYMVEAYKCYKNVSPTDGINCLKEAIDIFLTHNGQFRRAANFAMDLGELYENSGDVDNAIKSYEQAGDFFSTDSAPALANKAYLKCADLSALHGDYERAIQLFDNIIKTLVGNSLTKWSVKDYFFKNILCTLCLGDVVEAQKKNSEYTNEEPSWETTREFKLLQSIFDSIDKGDIQLYSDAVFDFDQFSKLDKLKTSLLLKVKSSIVEKDDDDLL